MEFGRYKVSISQNGWEYTGYVYIKAIEITKTGDRTIEADGVEIEFDEQIGEISLVG